MLFFNHHNNSSNLELPSEARKKIVALLRIQKTEWISDSNESVERMIWSMTHL